MEWQEYETVVRWIYEGVGSEKGVEILGHGAGCRRLGKSGIYHQIDVLTTQHSGLHTYLTGIECKYWKEKVNKDIVMKVNDIREDCNLDKAVIVTKMGFTEDAIKCAAYRNIQLVQLDEHNLRISGDTVTKFYMHQEISQPELVSTTVVVDENTFPQYKDHPFLKSADQYICTASNQKLDLKQLINDFLNNEVLRLQHSEMVTVKREFPIGTKLKSRATRGSIPINGIQFSGFNRIYTKLDHDYFHNKIWLALKLIFEKKDFMVTLAGSIEPWDNGEPIQLVVGRHVHMKNITNARQFTIQRNVNIRSAAEVADEAGSDRLIEDAPMQEN